jgi:hypothetical protein
VLEGVLCALLVACELDDCACRVVDASVDVLDVANVPYVEVCCPEVTTTIPPQSLGRRSPDRATPMMDPAGTRTVEHCWLTSCAILISPCTQSPLQLLTFSFLSLGKSARVQPCIDVLYAT